MIGFDSVKGRRPLKDKLLKLIDKGRIGHCYIFEGPNGSGKKLIADAFSELLFCDHPIGLMPCMKCAGCTGFKEKYILEKDKSIAVEDVRSLIADTELMPLGNKLKIYIIHNADTMTDQAQNAFLKTLEEPPKYAFFLLTVTNSERIIDTIRSRCIILYTGVNTKQEVLEYLKDKHPDVSEQDIYTAACFSEGCIGRADTLIHDENFAICRKMATDYIKTLKLDISSKDKRANMSVFLEILQSIFRDVVVYKSTLDMSNLINTDISDIIRRMADNNTGHSLLKAFETVTKTAEYIKDNVSESIAVGTMNIELAEELNI